MSKTKQPILTTSLKAAATVVRNRFAGFDGNYCGAGERPLGVFADDTPSGEYAPVDVVGITLVISGGAITAGAPVASDADGYAVAAAAASVAVPAGSTPVTSDGAQPTLEVSGGYLPEAVAGYALDAATDAGEIIRVRLA